MKANGAEPLPEPGGQQHHGVSADSGTGLMVGGATASARNVFGNPLTGVLIQGTADITIQGNYFGIDVAGQRAIFVGQFVSYGFAGIGVFGSGDVQILGNTIGAVLGDLDQQAARP